MAGKVLMRTH